MTRLEQVRVLRGDMDCHYNCCHAVIIPFLDQCGITRDVAFRLGLHFGGGMKMGSVCGAVTGALMVLGMAGGSEAQAKAFREAFLAQNGALDCVPLLSIAKERGVERKCHCDDMICQAVTLLEEILVLE